MTVAEAVEEPVDKLVRVASVEVAVMVDKVVEEALFDLEVRALEDTVETRLVEAMVLGVAVFFTLELNETVIDEVAEVERAEPAAAEVTEILELAEAKAETVLFDVVRAVTVYLLPVADGELVNESFQEAVIVGHTETVPCEVAESVATVDKVASVAVAVPVEEDVAEAWVEPLPTADAEELELAWVEPLSTGDAEKVELEESVAVAVMGVVLAVLVHVAVAVLE